MKDDTKCVAKKLKLGLLTFKLKRINIYYLTSIFWTTDVSEFCKRNFASTCQSQGKATVTS